MFSIDFKIHIECTEIFNSLIISQPEGIREILDIIFKWSCIKLTETNNNTKFAVAMFDFYANLF